MGGIAPNAGRAEVRYDDVWSNVCYESNPNDNQHWNYKHADVVCRELSFPGTMFARQGGQGQGTRSSIVFDFKCPKSEYIYCHFDLEL